MYPPFGGTANGTLDAAIALFILSCDVCQVLLSYSVILLYVISQQQWTETALAVRQCEAMPVAARAFRKLEKLRELYRSPEASAQSATRALGCNKCGYRFAVVFTYSGDRRNTSYDCAGGIHQDGYQLSVDLIP
jgi:hypothetical protein